MAITIDDFNKIWASTSPLTSYEFTEDNYKSGWNFIGGTPPSRQMWDFLQKQNDEKSQYLLNNFDNYLPLSGGTLTGVVNGVTPTAGDNSTKIATTEFVNAKAGNYLPLSGGTMTGSIQYVNNGKVFRIAKSDDGYVAVYWDWDRRDGAGLNLKSADYLKAPGEFSLSARDSANSCSLDGKPDGSLTWGGKEVERVNAKGNGYIRYESGLQICFGVTPNINQSTTTVTVTLPVAFVDVVYRVSLGRRWVTGYNEDYYFNDSRTTTSFQVVAVGTIGSNNHAYDYIAIGRWK